LINVCESARVIEPQVCARCFWTMDKKMNTDGIKFLNKKLTRSAVSSHSVRTPANINKVEDLALSQEDKQRKQFTMEHCMTD